MRYDNIAGDELAALAGEGLEPSRQFCGFTPTTLTTGLSGTIAVPLKANIFLDRPVFGTAACVALSRCSDIAVGTISVNVGSQPIPCEIWRYDATGNILNFPVLASPSVPPTVSVTNATAGTVIYEGGFIGRVSSARPPGA
jgi:hypothetical protein